MNYNAKVQETSANWWQRLEKKRFSEKTLFLGSVNKDLCEFGMDQRLFLELNAYRYWKSRVLNMWLFYAFVVGLILLRYLLVQRAKILMALRQIGEVMKNLNCRV